MSDALQEMTDARDWLQAKVNECGAKLSEARAEVERLRDREKGLEGEVERLAPYPRWVAEGQGDLERLREESLRLLDKTESENVRLRAALELMGGAFERTLLEHVGWSESAVEKYIASFSAQALSPTPEEG